MERRAVRSGHRVPWPPLGPGAWRVSGPALPQSAGCAERGRAGAEIPSSHASILRASPGLSVQVEACVP